MAHALLLSLLAATGHSPFQALPAHNGVLTLAWQNGEPQISPDRTPGSNHELYGFGWSNKLYVYKSGDLGVSWSFVDPTGGATVGASRLLGATQDSAGKAHLLFASPASGDIRYARIALEHTGGAITGFHAEVQNVALPGAYNGNNDLRGYVLPVVDQGGTEVLVFCVNDNPLNAARFRIQMGVGPLNAMTSGDFKKLDGTAGATVAFSGANGLDNHDHSALFAQLGATKDLWVFWGPIDAEYGLPDTTFMTRLQVSTSGAHTWSVGSPITSVGSDATSSPELLSVVGTQNYVWLLYLNPTKGLSIDHVAGNGTYSTDVVPSPDSTAHRNGWGVLSVADDESRMWAVWNTITSSSTNKQTKQAAFDGTSWATFTDAAPFTGDSWGMAVSWGWREGVVAVRLDGNTFAVQVSSVFSGIVSGAGGGTAGTGGGTAGTGGGTAGTGGGTAGTGGGTAGTGGGVAGTGGGTAGTGGGDPGTGGGTVSGGGAKCGCAVHSGLWLGAGLGLALGVRRRRSRTGSGGL